MDARAALPHQDRPRRGSGFYVLDAGNARIVVFDSARRYVTEWGVFGQGEGQFDFGLGGRRASGVPDFIYVVEGANRRIQKFAP